MTIEQKQICLDYLNELLEMKQFGFMGHPDKQLTDFISKVSIEIGKEKTQNIQDLCDNLEVDPNHSIIYKNKDTSAFSSEETWKSFEQYLKKRSLWTKIKDFFKVINC